MDKKKNESEEQATPDVLTSAEESPSIQNKPLAKHHLVVIHERHDEVRSFESVRDFAAAMVEAQRDPAVTSMYAFFGHRLTGKLVHTTGIELVCDGNGISMSDKLTEKEELFGRTSD